MKHPSRERDAWKPASPGTQREDEAGRRRPASRRGRSCPHALPLLLALLSGSAAAPALAQQPPGRVPSPTTISRDSARADSAAFATLPEAVREVLDVRRRIAPASADANVVCIPLSALADGSRRQRLQGRMGDGTSVVVFARFSPGGALQRVEFVRRLRSGEQHGYTWESTGDQTTGMEWPAGGAAAASFPVPRGGPIPRAVRALGRLVMTWACPSG